MVVPPGVGRCERAALFVVRPRADELLRPRGDQRADGAVEAALGERLGLTRAWAETGAPEQPLCLRYAESPPVDRYSPPSMVGSPPPAPHPSFGSGRAADEQHPRLAGTVVGVVDPLDLEAERLVKRDRALVDGRRDGAHDRAWRYGGEEALVERAPETGPALRR